MPRVSPITRVEVESAGLRWQDVTPNPLSLEEAGILRILLAKATGFLLSEKLAKPNNAEAWADAVSSACAERRAIDTLYGTVVADQKNNPVEV